MKVYELISQLSKLPAGNDVELYLNKSASNALYAMYEGEDADCITPDEFMNGLTLVSATPYDESTTKEDDPGFIYLNFEYWCN